MTDVNQFFERLEEQRGRKHPFVAYRDPSVKGGLVRALLQSNLEVYSSDDFTENGFIFAPFDQEKERVFIPQERSELLETELEEEEKIPFHQDTAFSNSQAITEKERHIDLVQKGIDAINEGQFKKVVLSRKEVLQTGPQDAIKLFKRLLRKYPAAYVYLFHHPLVGTWLGATPEVLLQVERNRFKTMALAGTQKYKGSTDVEWEEKEKDEQQIVTDTILESLKGSCRNIETTGPYTARAGGLLHLRTDITGEVISGNSESGEGNLKSLISAIHPTPAICGLPKQAAKEFILENEKYDREFYSGFLGEVNMKHEVKRSSNRRNQENQAYASHIPKTSLYVNLRCMKINKDTIDLFVGGGITKESVPIAEWEETLNKAGTMKAVLNMLDRKVG